MTINTHINPCFWMALWNEMYNKDIQKKGYSDLKARKQIVRYLEIRSNKGLQQKVEKVHFEKGLGIAKVTREGIINFCKKYHPEKYSDFVTEMESHPEDVFLDFENHFTEIENLPVYQVLLKIAHQQRMQEGEDYPWLTQFLLIHPLRSHVFINKASKIARKNGDEKFVLFYFLKWSLADPNFLFPQSLGILNSEWNFYVLKKNTFPLSDQPVLIRKNFILATLSPTMILFIKRNRNKIVIGKQQCTGFGKQECTTFGNKGAQKMATRMHNC